MHPSVVRDAQGSCPICGMDLVPMEADASTAGPLGISPERQRRAGLRTTAVARSALDVTRRLSAVVVVDEDARVSVPTRLTGWLTKVAVSLNQPVKAGALLATVESPEATAAAREWLALRAAGPEASQAGIQRLRSMGVPAGEVAAMERTSRLPSSWSIRSPRAGFVVRRPEAVDAPVESGDVLFELVDSAHVLVEASVPVGTTLPAVGDEAVFRPDDDPRNVQGKIISISPIADPVALSKRVRVSLQAPDARLRPGQTGELALGASRETTLVVPREAVVETGLTPCVWVMLEGDRFERRDVVLGERDATGIAILDGLGEGELVVTDGNFLVEAETRLRREAGVRP